MEQIEIVPTTQAGRPLYLQVKDALSAGLAVGKWKPRDQLPTETELSREFGVSEGTIRQAIVALVNEGRLTRRSGKGTFVARARFDQSFARFFRFRGSGEAKYPEYAVTVLKIKTGVAVSPSVKAELGLSANSSVLMLHRAIKQDRTLVCHYMSYLSNRDFGGLSKANLENAALYDVLERNYGVYIVRAVETLQARAASANDAEILAIRRGDPVIAIERLAYTYGDRVVEVRHTVGRSDKFRYQTQLT
jgi:GntR family transcriptional regulator